MSILWMELQIDIDIIAVFNKSIKNNYLHNFWCHISEFLKEIKNFIAVQLDWNLFRKGFVNWTSVKLRSHQHCLYSLPHAFFVENVVILQCNILDVTRGVTVILITRYLDP